MVRGPAIPENETREQLVTNLDLPATIVELAGATPQRVLDGRSLMPLFTDANAAWRTAFLVEGNDVVEGDEDGGQAGYYAGVRTAGDLYAEHVDLTGAYTGNEFYDLAADPFELESRPDDPDYAQTVAALKQQLNALESCAGASCFVAGAPGAHKVGETWRAGDRTVTIAQAIQ